MIRREGPDGTWLLVRQTDHARLSGRLATRWGNDRFRPPVPRDEVVLGIGHHDDGWAGWERRPRASSGTGIPFDFTEIPLDDHLGIWRRGPEEIVEEHPYGAILVIAHGMNLMRMRLRRDDLPAGDAAALSTFQEEQVVRIAELASRLQGEEARHARADRLLANVRLLGALDLLSLVLCCGWPRERTMGPFPGTDEERAGPVRILPAENGRVHLDPWPFGDDDELTCTVPARRVPRDLGGTEDLREAWQDAEPEDLTFVLEPGAP